MAKNLNEMVRIRHKSSPKTRDGKPTETAQVSRRAFERTWKDKGWEIVEKDSPKATTSAKPSD